MIVKLEYNVKENVTEEMVDNVICDHLEKNGWLKEEY